MKKKLTYEEVSLFISSNGCSLLTPKNDYKNTNEKISILCRCGINSFEVSFDKFKNRNKRQCNACSYKILGLKLRNREINSLDYNTVKSIIDSEGGFILLTKNYKNNRQKLEIECPKSHIFLCSLSNFKKGNRCPICSKAGISGENSNLWKGGISSINTYLRDKITIWKKDSMKHSGYKCIISGDKFDDIHHLYSFHLIVEEAMDKLNLDIRENISKYSNIELQMLIDKVIKLHYEYPLGVCLRRDIHDLFHHIYGFSNNTPEQFEEFKNNYLNGSIITEAS